MIIMKHQNVLFFMNFSEPKQRQRVEKNNSVLFTVLNKTECIINQT